MATTIGPDRPPTGSRAERARRAADLLRQQIAAGAFPTLVLPDERVLGSQLDASRNAVREALNLLRAEGLITRKQGVGTAIVRPTIGHGLDRLAGLGEALTGYGAITNEVRAAHRLADPPPAIAARLALSPGTPVVYLERLRRLDGIPLSLDTTYLAADIGLPLLQHDLTGQDVFALIEKTTGRTLGSAELTVHAVNADPDTAALLDVQAEAAMFAIERLTRFPDGRPIDVESMHIRADRLTLNATLHRSPPS